MPEHRSGRSREFDEPIAVPDGGTLVTLHDAADYITALPDEVREFNPARKEHHWGRRKLKRDQ
jgi:hypothetical protein